LTVQTGVAMVRDVMTQSFRVVGGNPIAGTVRPAGNKNAALPIIAASLMADGISIIRNVPRIRDVESLIALAADLGASCRWLGERDLQVDARGLRVRQLNPKLCAAIRASILLAGPLLARFGEVILPPPGGDVIGRRRLDTHFLALEALGATVETGQDYTLRARRLVGARIFLDEPSVTATENAMMAASLSKGTTVIRNAASEPHVQDLAHALCLMGARIEGIGTNVITVDGVSSLEGAELTVGPDHIEIGSFIGLAAVTGGTLQIEGVEPEHLHSILFHFRRLGIQTTLEGNRLLVDSNQERRVKPDFGGHIPKIEDGPWPAFPADLMSIMVVVATQCDGEVLLFEKMFESRLYFVDLLIGLGARIVLCDPHRALVSGRTKLHGGTVQSPDIRAGMAVLLATLAASGESVIHNVPQIDRGYERIDERLRTLGAVITRE
jgi:UDP-N-acetylglucosamine 1-carboxyvinyltransferase